jgi:hypothetical protein
VGALKPLWWAFRGSKGQKKKKFFRDLSIFLYFPRIEIGNERKIGPS